VRDPRRRGGAGIRDLISRRRFLLASAGVALWPLAGGARQAPRRRGLAAAQGALPDALRAALDKSPYVYVSPLRADGSESTCHGEVWFAWLDGAVVLITAKTSWKARAQARGLERARIWAGDYGRWKQLGVRSEGFRAGPSFVARAKPTRDTALLDRMLATFDTKYPDEIGRWRDRMRKEYEDGSRVLLRYLPEPAART
jgi:hypothetical protein